MDNRINNGGARKGAGRKPKDEEEKAKQLSIKALIFEFGSTEDAFKHAAERAKNDKRRSYEYFRLLIEHAYGKPKESLNINPDNDFHIPLTTFFSTDDEI